MYEESKEALIGSLASSRAYKALVDEVKGSFDDIEQALKGARTDEETIQAARYWQVTHRLLDTLVGLPSRYRNTVENQLQTYVGLQVKGEEE